MKSRYSHIYSKAIKSISKIELLNKIRQVVQPGEPIQGRKSYFGQSVFNNMSKFQNVFNFDPRDLAVCLHIFLNLPITKNEIVVNLNMDDYLVLSNEIIENFELNLLHIFYRCHPKNRKIKLTSNFLTKRKSSIINRFENQNKFMKSL